MKEELGISSWQQLYKINKGKSSKDEVEDMKVRWYSVQVSTRYNLKICLQFFLYNLFFLYKFGLNETTAGAGLFPARKGLTRLTKYSCNTHNTQSNFCIWSSWQPPLCHPALWTCVPRQLRSQARRLFFAACFCRTTTVWGAVIAVIVKAHSTVKVGGLIDIHHKYYYIVYTMWLALCHCKTVIW